MTFRITTLSRITFVILTLSIKGFYVTLSITDILHCAECQDTECRVLFIVMLNVIMLNAIMLSDTMLNFVILTVFALNVIMLSTLC
jgi:hypothetical protein